jgi:hypothetical protein
MMLELTDRTETLIGHRETMERPGRVDAIEILRKLHN